MRPRRPDGERLADLLVFLVHPRGWPFVAALIAAGLAARAERSGWSERTRRRIAGLALAAIAAAAALIVGFPVYPALGPGMAAIAFAAIALGLLGGADRRTALALALAALLPLAAAIGTTNDTVSQTSLYAGVLGLVALAAAMAARRNGAVAVVALCLVLVTGSAVWKGLAKPYRLAAPIWRQTEPVEIGTRGERLKLDPRAAAFVRSLRDGAKRRGFCSGDPIIDLSGELPGIAVLLGGGTPGFPWLFGGYPFSERLAGWILSGRRSADARPCLARRCRGPHRLFGSVRRLARLRSRRRIRPCLRRQPPALWHAGAPLPTARRGRCALRTVSR